MDTETTGNTGRKLSVAISMPLSGGWTGRVQVVEGDTLVYQDEGRLTKGKVRLEIVERAAVRLKLTDIEQEDLAKEVESIWMKTYQRIMQEMEAGTSQADAASLLAGMPQEVKDGAEELLQDPIPQIMRDLEAVGVAGEKDTALCLYMVGVSRLQDKPLSTRIHGLSTSGKTFLAEQVYYLFPPEVVLWATQITPAALYHMPYGSLIHRLIVAGERSHRMDPAQADATKGLREMQVSGRLSKLMPVKLAGETVTRQIYQPGPIAYVEGTTQEPDEIFDEDLNRCLALRTDGSAEQTARILKRTAHEYMLLTLPGDRETVRDIHHAAQRMLQPYRVIIPYAEELAEAMDPHKIEVRRVFTQVLGMIQAVTLLNQYRHSDGDHLVSTWEEYALARQLLVEPIRRLLGSPVSQECIDLYKGLPHDRDFSTSELGSNRSKLLSLLEVLERVGSVIKVLPGSGKRATVWRRTNRDPVKEDVLPSCETIKAKTQVRSA